MKCNCGANMLEEERYFRCTCGTILDKNKKQLQGEGMHDPNDKIIKQPAVEETEKDKESGSKEEKKEESNAKTIISETEESKEEKKEDSLEEPKKSKKNKKD